MKKHILMASAFVLVGTILPRMAFADATANVTNLINRLDPLTANVVSNFVMLTDIPRPTYHEKKVSDALVAWAKERGFSPYQDEKNNVWFDVSATPGMEMKTKVILQGHMDMVAAGFDDPENECVTLDCDENGKIFSKNHKTSIGADDGLGVAMALAVADGKVPHGPVRVLVTTDEEQTETGAMAVPPEILKGISYLVNIDSETDGELTISSAASDTISVTGTVTTVSAAKSSAYCVKIENFRGGHSGQDIAKERLNAILELGRVLTNAVAQGIKFELAEMTGGNAKNAIPPHAQAIVTIDESQKPQLEELLSAAQTDFRNREEANATVSLVATNGITTLLDETTCANVLTYLTTVHDGVWNMSSEIPDLVETSMNHGLIDVTKDGVLISGAARGSVENTVQAEETSISNTAKTCGFDFAMSRACAPWPANTANPLISIFSNAWKKVTGTEMSIVATHAGLECGWFSIKAPKLNIVSVGPTIQNPHTVNETTYASSVSNNVQLLSKVLATLPEPILRTWMTVDLKSGLVSYHDYDFTTATNTFNTEEYKSTKMAFRRIPAGDNYYVQNGVYTAQMTNSYYLGLFEVTIAQYELIKDAAYVRSGNEALRTQGNIRRETVRGNKSAPSSFGALITAESPLGQLNARVQAATGNDKFVFDLPNEAMWEVAARAVDSGDETQKTWSWHFGETKANLDLYAFWGSKSASDSYGNTSGLRVPGCKLPNAWGLYDMYGNAAEICLDGADENNSPAASQINWSETPQVSGDGASLVRYRNQRTRGGGYSADYDQADSLYRSYQTNSDYAWCGIRLALICWGEPVPVPPGGEVNVPSGYETATEFAVALNDGTANKADYLKAPGGVTTTTAYLSYFSAVPSGEATVAFVLNADGTNAVETATETVGTNALEVALSPSVTTFTIADPLVGFYYSLKQGGAVTNLLFHAEGDRNKLGGRDAISFGLEKPEGAGFYQTLITPSEYTE